MKKIFLSILFLFIAVPLLHAAPPKPAKKPEAPVFTPETIPPANTEGTTLTEVPTEGSRTVNPTPERPYSESVGPDAADIAKGKKEGYAGQLEGMNLFQAEQWLKIMRNLWTVGDYVPLREYCYKTIAYYPGTPYAKQAKKYLKKTNKLSKNRRRNYFQNNPGLFLGAF